MEAAERIEEEFDEHPLVFRTNGEVLDLVRLASYEPEEEPTKERPTLRAVTTNLIALVHSEIRDICAYIEERAQEA